MDLLESNFLYAARIPTFLRYICVSVRQSVCLTTRQQPHPSNDEIALFWLSRTYRTKPLHSAPKRLQSYSYQRLWNTWKYWQSLKTFLFSNRCTAYSYSTLMRLASPSLSFTMQTRRWSLGRISVAYWSQSNNNKHLENVCAAITFKNHNVVCGGWKRQKHFVCDRSFQ